MSKQEKKPAHAVMLTALSETLYRLKMNLAERAHESDKPGEVQSRNACRKQYRDHIDLLISLIGRMIIPEAHRVDFLAELDRMDTEFVDYLRRMNEDPYAKSGLAELIRDLKAEE